MKFMNKIGKDIRRNDWDTAQLYEHGDVLVMSFSTGKQRHDRYCSYNQTVFSDIVMLASCSASGSFKCFSSLSKNLFILEYSNEIVLKKGVYPNLTTKIDLHITNLYKVIRFHFYVLIFLFDLPFKLLTCRRIGRCWKLGVNELINGHTWE